MTTKQQEATELRESLLRMAGRTFRMGYEAMRVDRKDIAAKAQCLWKDCFVAANKARRLMQLSSKLR